MKIVGKAPARAAGVPLFALALALSASAAAQDFNRIAPKEVPRPAPNDRLAPGSTGGRAVLAKALKGVIFLTDPKSVKLDPITDFSGVDVSRVPELQTPEARSHIDKFLGQALTLDSIDALTNEVVAYYTGRDRPFVVVTAPPQEVTGGVLQLLVVEGRVGTVSVTGAKYFDEKVYRNAIGLKPGDPILKQKLDEDIEWINRNPFRDATAVLEPGQTFGTTDVNVRVRDRYPLRAYAGYEDSGNNLTGIHRAVLGANWGNAFGLGHQLNYQFTGSTDFDAYRAHSATYIAPLASHHILTVFGAHADIKSNVLAPFANDGRSSQLGLRYEVPLARRGTFRQSLIGGLDYKRTNNNLEFGGAIVTATTAEILQGVFGYDASDSDRLGTSSITANVYLSPGGLTGDNEDANFRALRALSKSNYAYANIQFRRLTRLPADFSWHLTAEAQMASANLLPSEQIGAGGYATVRGYDEREANGDQGVLVRNEVRTPAYNLGAPLGGKQAQIQFLTFVDYGNVRSKHLLPGERSRIELASAGLGLRFTIDPNVTLRFDYGWQLHDDGVVGGRDNSRAHFALLVAY